MVVECPQTLYGDGQDPHLTQGLFKGTVESLGSIEDGMLRTVQVQLDEAPLPGSLALYSASTYDSLQHVRKQNCSCS